jgi:antitoxin (DNA-binding transcriptional repressor) of toxin-antitoxin stability system
MRTVGVRELKNRLSQYLRAVRAGEQLLVTDRGEVIAELRPPGPVPAAVSRGGLLELARRGDARLGTANAPEAYPELPAAATQGTSARLLDAERGER